MLTIGDRVCDESVRIVNSGRIGKINHSVRIVLLCARVRIREERIDAVHPSKLDARFVGEDVSVADQLESQTSMSGNEEVSRETYTKVLPALCNIRQVGLGNTLGYGLTTGVRKAQACGGDAWQGNAARG